MRPNRYHSAGMLFFIVILNGCAVESFLFSSQPERAGFVITRPPVKVIFKGHTTDENKKFVHEIIKLLQKEPTNDYKFNETIKVDIKAIDAKSDKVNINLSEAIHVNDSEEIKEEITE